MEGGRSSLCLGYVEVCVPVCFCVLLCVAVCYCVLLYPSEVGLVMHLSLWE